MIRKIGEICIIDLPNDTFLMENINKLKSSIVNVIENGSLNILLNMTEVARIDGSGLGELLNLQKMAFYNEVTIRLYGLQPYVAELMSQTGLSKVLDICQAENENFADEQFLDLLLA